MKTHLFLIISLLLLTGSLNAQDNTASVQLAAAIYEEEVTGDLDKAVMLYLDILRKYPDDRPVVAKTLYHLGLANEKMGKDKAIEYFRRLINNYPDQTEVVALAKAKLAALDVAPDRTASMGLAVRRLLPGSGVDATGAPSPDGRYLSISDPESGDLAVLEIRTGQKRRLTNKGSWSTAECAIMSKWSPDGQKIAYLWLNKDMLPELRIMEIDGTGTRTLPVGGWILDWSPDGKYLLARVPEKNGTYDLALISVADGSLNIIKTAQTIFRAAFSPDGEYVVYELPQQKDSPPYDLFMLTSDGKSEMPIVTHPANDRLLGWVPGTEFILFTSDRTGTQDAWALCVTNGQPQGYPVLVKQDIGQASPMGFTAEGSLFYSVMRSIVEAYEDSLNLGKGAVTGLPKKIFERVVGMNYIPEWSPDGNYLACIAERKTGSSGQNSYILCVQSEQTGEVQEVPLTIKSLWGMHWSAGSDAVFAAMADDANQGIFKINIQTGKQTLVAKSGPESLIKNFAVSPDGKSVYYAYFQWTKKLVTIIRHDLESGQEQELYRKEAPPDIGSTMVSPDGKYVSFITSDFTQDVIRRIMPAAGGETRDLLKDKFGSFAKHVWTPDGKTILFLRRTDGTKEEKRELWQVPSEGGEPSKIDIKMDLNDLRLHPDGRRIAFTSGKTTNELWVMENFLPKQKIEADNQLTMRKLDNSQLNTPFARLAPDGQKIAYVEYSEEGSPTGINILEIGSGKTKMLVEGNVSGQSSMVWSPQSNRIAYTFNGNELHIRDVDGSNSRVLLKNTAYLIHPSDWSRDGKKIVCFFEGDDGTVRIGTVAADGQVQFLASGNSSDFKSEPKISPDGSYITCSLDDKTGNTDIYVWTSDGIRKEQVTTHPGRDENPVWSPDGKYLVFLSDRNRSVDLWGVQMKDGAVVDAPSILKQDLGWRTRINDFTASGKLFLFMLGGAEPGNLFTVPVDQVSGRLSGNIAPISVYPTDHFFPRNSPSGKMIAYLSRRGQPGWPKLFLMDEKGAEREIPLQGHYATNIAWHPENKSLFFTGWDKSFNTGVFEVSLEKGEIRPVVSSDTVDLKTFKGALVNINLLKNERKLMFFRSLRQWDWEILTCDPEGQQLTVVLPRINMPVWGSPSPSGENICYRTGDSLMMVNVSSGTSMLIGSSTVNLEATWAPDGERLIFREGSRLKIFSLKENSTRNVYQAPEGKMIGGMELYASAWSPDGNRFIFTESDTSISSPLPQKLILMNPGDGSVNVLGAVPTGYRLSDLQWSPDGRKVVATGNSIRSEDAPLYNYWIMENFLPK